MLPLPRGLGVTFLDSHAEFLSEVGDELAAVARVARAPHGEASTAREGEWSRIKVTWFVGENFGGG
jgi:hypothetical protein